MIFGVVVILLLFNSIFSGVSVSECMRKSMLYRIVLSSLMIGQFMRWSHFISSLSHTHGFSSQCLLLANLTFGFLSQCFLLASCVCWIGLCADLYSNGHYIWTFLFGANFSCMAFSFFPLLHSEYDVMVWTYGFLSLLISILACLVALNTKHVGWLEHVAFIVYNITFVSFFFQSL